MTLTRTTKENKMWEQKQPGLLEQLASLFGSKKPYKTFVNKTPFNNPFSVPAANASMYNPEQTRQEINPDKSPASQYVREALSAYHDPNGPDFVGAIQSFQKAINTDPSQSEYYKTYIDKLIKEKQATDAMLKRKQLEQFLSEQKNREKDLSVLANNEYIE
jgi:hypothetical protein